MWKPEQRLVADRSCLRYPSDLTDSEWAIVEPMIPPARQGGRKRSVNVGEVLNGIFYILWTGCQWKALVPDSKSFPSDGSPGSVAIAAWRATLNVMPRPSLPSSASPMLRQLAANASS